MADDVNVVEESKKEAMVRGQAFDEMIRSEGWKYVKAYIENKIKAFANSVLTGDKDISIYEGDRREIIGLRKLLGSIETDIKVLRDEYKKDTEPTKE